MLIDGEVFESFDSCFRCALRLQIRLQDVHIIVGLLEALALDCLDALQQLATIEDRLWFVGGSSRRLAVDEGESVGADAESLKISTRDVQINFIAPDMDVTDLIQHLRIRWVNLISNPRHWRRF